MNRYLDVAPEVQEALKAGKPVVALESTIISHGMPYPQNVETALNVEKIIRDAGAGLAQIVDLLGGQAGLQAAADDGDGGGHGARVADNLLDLERGFDVLRVGHAVGNDGGFERHDGLAGGKGLGNLGGDIQILVHVKFLL